MRHRIFEVIETITFDSTHWVIGPSEKAVRDVLPDYCIGEDPESTIKIREIGELEAHNIMINCEGEVESLLSVANYYSEEYIGPIAGSDYE